MKKNWTRALSLLLAVLLCVSTFGTVVSVSATEADGQGTTEDASGDLNSTTSDGESTDGTYAVGSVQTTDGNASTATAGDNTSNNEYGTSTVAETGDDQTGSDSTGENTNSGKSLTVGSDETYTTIQDAIDYINGQSDKDGWTITVKSGTYTYFTVNQYISNLTITGEEGATVNASDGSIQLMGDTITLVGLTFTATGTAWSVPVIKDASSNAGLYYDSMVTIKNCDFKGTNAGCALWICRLNSTVQNCTFDGFNLQIARAS